MVHTETFATAHRTLECGNCLERVTTEAPLSRCPACGGEMHNLSVPRE